MTEAKLLLAKFLSAISVRMNHRKSLTVVYLVCDNCKRIFKRPLMQYEMNQTWRQEHQFCSIGCFHQFQRKKGMTIKAIR